MKTLIFLLTIVVVVIGAFFWPTVLPAQSEIEFEFNTVLRVIDENTLQILTEKSYATDGESDSFVVKHRYINIYGLENGGVEFLPTEPTAEFDRTDYDEEDGSRRFTVARAFLAFLAPPGTEIIVEEMDGGDYLVKAGGKDVAYQMIVLDMLRATAAKYLEAETIAKDARVGIWNE